LCAQLTDERGLVQVVDERPLAVDLDHRQPLAVAGLELGVAADVDLAQLELVLPPQLGELPARPLAEMAALGVVDGDARRYGYNPRVVVASATRWTASP
jgi:hypothetical protein